MGCWNETCMVSRLPIRCGDPVIGFALKRQKPYPHAENNNYERPIYPTDDFEVLPLLIHGTYNDYGSIENIVENESTDLFKKLIGKKEIQDAVNHCERDDETNSPSGYNLAMIRKDVFQYFSPRISNKSKDFKEIVDALKIKREISSMEKMEYNEETRALFKKMYAAGMVFRDYAGHGRGFDVLHGDEIEEYLEKNKKHQERIIKDLLITRALNRDFMGMRITWHPPGHPTQETDWESHLKLHLRIVQICKDKIAEEELL